MARYVARSYTSPILNDGEAEKENERIVHLLRRTMVKVYEEDPFDEPVEHMYSVWLPYAAYGVIVDVDGILVRTPPIARWAVGRELTDFKKWVTKKGGRVKLHE
jgi:hypothetical protein